MGILNNRPLLLLPHLGLERFVQQRQCFKYFIKHRPSPSGCGVKHLRYFFSPLCPLPYFLRSSTPLAVRLTARMLRSTLVCREDETRRSWAEFVVSSVCVLTAGELASQTRLVRQLLGCNWRLVRTVRGKVACRCLSGSCVLISSLSFKRFPRSRECNPGLWNPAVSRASLEL